MEALLNYLDQAFGTATVLVTFYSAVVFGGAIWITHVLTKFTTKWRGQEDIIKSLQDSWNRDIPTIKERTNLVFQRVYSDKTAIETSSPARLTQIGEEIRKNMTADEILNQHSTDLTRLVSSKDPRNAYDLQQACFSVVEENLTELLSSNTLDIAKTLAMRYGIPLDNVLSVVAILLRDSLMQKYGWSYADIDKHDTNTNSSVSC